MSAAQFEKAKQDPAGKKQRMAAADGKVYFRYATGANTLSRARALERTQHENAWILRLYYYLRMYYTLESIHFGMYRYPS